MVSASTNSTNEARKAGKAAISRSTVSPGYPAGRRGLAGPGSTALPTFRNLSVTKTTPPGLSPNPAAGRPGVDHGRGGGPTGPAGRGARRRDLGVKPPRWPGQPSARTRQLTPQASEGYTRAGSPAC